MENHQNNKEIIERAKEQLESRDLEVEVTSPIGRAWEEELFKLEEALAKNKITVEIQEAVIELGKKRIIEEKEKFK